MEVRVAKPFRHGMRVFEVGEIGEVVPTEQVKWPLIFDGKPVYDYYVRFGDHYPIGVRKDEIEVISEGGK